MLKVILSIMCINMTTKSNVNRTLMKRSLLSIGAAIALVSTTTALAAPIRRNLDDVLNQVSNMKQSEIKTEELVTEEVIAQEKVWKCTGCTPSEKFILAELQKQTNVSDRNALATILGNIKQESMFHSNICEGGARVPYHNCYSGGYGLIQWTTASRYHGLGHFCKKYGCDPSTLAGQTRYMINEVHFQAQLPYFERVGLTVRDYMRPAYRWLGWGIKGNREHYTYQYVNMMVFA